MTVRYQVETWIIGRSTKLTVGYSDSMDEAQGLLDRHIDRNLARGMVVTQFRDSAHFRKTTHHDLTRIVRIKKVRVSYMWRGE